MPRAEEYAVYVIELDPEVLDDRRFAAANPDYVPGKPCVYVGMTGIRPVDRFLQHRTGYRANRYARRFGLWLKNRLMKRNPMTRAEAQSWEVELARRLRNRGYAVWQN